MADLLRTQTPFDDTVDHDPAHVIAKAFGVLDQQFQARFSPRRFVGGGGYGWVYEGIDNKFGSKVALKFMKTEREANFRAEAKLTKECQHPHVVIVYDYGKDHGIAWMAMEFLEGVSLKRRLRGNEGICQTSSTGLLPTLGRSLTGDSGRGQEPGQGVSLKLISRFVREIADALEYAHREKKVHHQDLKPENILLVNEGKAGECFKLLDFGIATKLDADATMKNAAFRSALTLAYASPERLDARLKVDGMEERSEVYSFGVILYEMITGHLPFEWGGTMEEQARAMHETLFSPAPRFPGRVQISDHHKARALETLVLSCLAKQPADRPESLAKFAAEFEDLTRTSAPSRRGFLIAGGVAIALLSSALIWQRFNAQDDNIAADPPVLEAAFPEQTYELIAGSQLTVPLSIRGQRWDGSVDVRLDSDSLGDDLKRLMDDGQLTIEFAASKNVAEFTPVEVSIRVPEWSTEAAQGTLKFIAVPEDSASDALPAQTEAQITLQIVEKQPVPLPDGLNAVSANDAAAHSGDGFHFDERTNRLFHQRGRLKLSQLSSPVEFEVIVPQDGEPFYATLQPVSREFFFAVMRDEGNRPTEEENEAPAEPKSDVLISAALTFAIAVSRQLSADADADAEEKCRLPNTDELYGIRQARSGRRAAWIEERDVKSWYEFSRQKYLSRGTVLTLASLNELGSDLKTALTTLEFLDENGQPSTVGETEPNDASSGFSELGFSLVIPLAGYK